MKARTHKVIGTIAVAMGAAGVLAGGALAQSAPDWVERAAGVGTSSVNTASTVVPLPDWVDRAAKRGHAATLATAPTRVSPPDWVERAILRASAR
jgi:hypothetical protein